MKKMIANINIVPDFKKYYFFEDAVKCFETYEQAINNKNFDEISKCQSNCLHSIDKLIEVENAAPNFEALFFIREDLLVQIQQIENEKQQIISNDITVTLISNQVSTFLPTFVTSTIKALETKIEPPVKKQKNSNEAEKLQDIIENTKVIPQSSGLDDIVGLYEAKEWLKEAIVFPIKYSHLYTGGRKKWSKALLYGPPGTGKTQLAHCLAAETKSHLYNVSPSDLLSSYVGESEKLIKTLFQYCQTDKNKSLIFIDEIDSICRTRNSKDDEHGRRFKSQLLTQLSEIDRNPNNTIFFIACTNCPWDLDPAFIRRFQLRIHIPLPDRATRLKMLKLHANLNSSENWDNILDQTEGWSGSDIADLINFAMQQPIKDLKTSNQWILTKDNYYMPVKNSKHSTLRLTINDIPPEKITARPVTLSDFFIALKIVGKTVSSETLSKFEEFNESYGLLKNSK